MSNYNNRIRNRHFYLNILSLMISSLAEAGTSTCADIAQNCQDSYQFCRNSAFVNFMQQNCQLTCGYCSTTTIFIPTSSQLICEDKGTNCGPNSALCFNPTYRRLMRENCLKSCNYCIYAGFGYTLPPAQPSTCIDRNYACSSWESKGFCKSRFYSQAVKEKKCARTCRFC